MFGAEQTVCCLQTCTLTKFIDNLFHITGIARCTRHRYENHLLPVFVRDIIKDANHLINNSIDRTISTILLHLMGDSTQFLAHHSTTVLACRIDTHLGKVTLLILRHNMIHHQLYNILRTAESVGAKVAVSLHTHLGQNAFTLIPVRHLRVFIANLNKGIGKFYDSTFRVTLEMLIDILLIELSTRQQGFAF